MTPHPLIKMADNQKIVPRETPPLSNLGPMVEVDMDVLADRLARMSPKDKKYLEYLLEQHAVLIKSKGSHT
jgi:hypothetical protein